MLVGSAQPVLLDATPAQLRHSIANPRPEFVGWPELDRLGRAGLGARRLHTLSEPVVTHGAFPCPLVVVAWSITPNGHAWMQSVGARRQAHTTDG